MALNWLLHPCYDGRFGADSMVKFWLSCYFWELVMDYSRIFNRRNIECFFVCAMIIFIVLLMYARVFYGVELTDEAYYVAEAKANIEGNVMFSYNTGIVAGFPFIASLLVALYRAVIPSVEGVFLFTRLCFVTYKVLICIVIYKGLKNGLNHKYALLLVGLILPINGYLPNFSYNTIPVLSLLMAGILLYDAVEQHSSYDKVEIFVAGVAAAIACWANPGWGIVVLFFSALLYSRLGMEQDKKRLMALFFGAILAVGIIIFTTILLKTSFSELCHGLYRTFISPVPMDLLVSGKSWGNVLESFKRPFLQWVKIFSSVSVLCYFFSKRYVSENREKLGESGCLFFSLSMGMFVHLLSIGMMQENVDIGIIGFVAVCNLCVFWVAGLFKDEKIIWYVGIYPIVYSVAVICFSEVSGIWRFINSYTVFLPILYVLFKCKSELVRLMAVITTCFLITSYVYLDFVYVYRDESIQNLKYQVSSGIYKGIYTTAARAHDLPELEQYLNKIISENETYAFRDNVPAGYLMVHEGQMCDICTWDCMQYYYHANSPAKLFDYYQRRNMIPDKIIYVDHYIYQTLDKYTVSYPQETVYLSICTP